MAAFHGKAGKVMWDSSTGYEAEAVLCIDWICNVSVETAEITKMADTWKTHQPSFKDWTASVTCLFDSGGVTIPLTAAGGIEALGEATPAKLELWLDETAEKIKIVYGSAICTDISISTASTEIPTVTYNFQGDGVLAWSATDPSYA